MQHNIKETLPDLFRLVLCMSLFTLYHLIQAKRHHALHPLRPRPLKPSCTTVSSFLPRDIHNRVTSKHKNVASEGICRTTDIVAHNYNQTRNHVRLDGKRLQTGWSHCGIPQDTSELMCDVRAPQWTWIPYGGGPGAEASDPEASVLQASALTTKLPCHSALPWQIVSLELSPHIIPHVIAYCGVCLETKQTLKAPAVRTGCRRFDGERE